MPHRYPACWVGLLSTLLAAPVCGQTESTGSAATPLTQVDSARFRNHRYNEFFRGNRDFSYLSPGGELGAPSKYVINGELIASYFLLASPKTRLSVAVTQRFMARTRTDRSSPIRTPSFRLGTQVFYRLSANVTSYQYLEAQFFHHSNGQDGAVFRPNGTYNTETGDFSTNYLQATYNWGTHDQQAPRHVLQPGLPLARPTALQQLRRITGELWFRPRNGAGPVPAVCPGQP